MLCSKDYYNPYLSIYGNLVGTTGYAKIQNSLAIVG
jgi:hypothetical protein